MYRRKTPMKEPSILTIGGATFDIFAKAHESEIIMANGREMLAFPHGGKVPIDSVQEFCGGGATNVAVGLARLGCDVATIISVGDHAWGDRVTENLAQEGVATDLVQRNEMETGFSIILNSKTGDRTVLGFSGANELLRFTEPKKMPDGVFLNHLAGGSSLELPKIETWLSAHPNITFAWNPGKEQIKEGVLAYKSLLSRVDMLFLNKEEAAEFLGKSVEPIEAMLSSFTQLGAKIAVITDGKNGAFAKSGDELFFQPIPEGQPRVDTLGAGDAFATGFFYGIITKNGLKKALSYGTINATSVVSCFGAQPGLLDKETLTKRSENPF